MATRAFIPIALPEQPAPAKVERIRANGQERIVEAFRSGFGQRLPADFAVEPFLAGCQGHPAPGLIPAGVELLGKLGCPCDPLFLASWIAMLRSAKDLAVHEEIIQLFAPRDQAEWETLVRLIQAQSGEVSLERVFGLAGDLGNREPDRALAMLEELVESLPAESERNACLSALRACRHLGMKLEDLGAVVGRYARDSEVVAALGVLGSVLLAQGQKNCTPSQFERLLGAFPDRAAAKRFAGVLRTLAQSGVKADAFDSFVMSFAGSSDAVEWLEAAVSGLRRLSRPIDQEVLARLRKWAPGRVAVEHYIRGSLALSGLGLSEETIDELVRPRLGNEADIAILCSLRDMSLKLNQGNLTRDRAERLLGYLPGRASVKRLRQAIDLLLSLALPPADIEALAPEFVASADDVAWLEALEMQSRKHLFPMDRAEVVKLRNLCPDVAQLYRYFRIRLELQSFKAGVSLVAADIAAQASREQENTATLLTVLAMLKGLGRQGDVDDVELRRMYLIRRLPSIVRRQAAS